MDNNTSYIENITDLCRNLKLGGMKAGLDRMLEEANKGGWPYERFLAGLLQAEDQHRTEARIRALVKRAGFPQKKYLEDLERDKLPKDMLTALPELETLDFIRSGQNVVMYGTPGTGKTHCAIGLGIRACTAGMSVLYSSVPRMLVEIKECESKRKLSRLYKKYEKYDLAILDECGYKSLDKVAAEQLFNLISLRSDRKSTIITTNLGFDKWDTIFTDKVVAAAIVDRLTFKSYIIDMNAPSYRISATEQWISERAGKKAAEGKKSLK